MVVTVVVVFNFALALVLLYLAWQVRQLGLQLAQIADTLTMCEQSTYEALHNTPDAIYASKQGIKQLRQRREPLQLQLQRVRQILILFGIGQKIWRRSSWQFPNPVLQRKNKTSLY